MVALFFNTSKYIPKVGEVKSQNGNKLCILILTNYDFKYFIKKLYLFFLLFQIIMNPSSKRMNKMDSKLVFIFLYCYLNKK